MVIGIPRALIYWKRPFFWENFFENLGFEVLLSPNTNKEIVEMGTKAADPEACFSNKVYWGHLLWLDGKVAEVSPHLSKRSAGREMNEVQRIPPRAASRHSVCDLIFIPRLKTNREKLEYCPKFFGLPDLAKILIKTPILTETFDERKEKFEKSLEKLGKKLNKPPPPKFWCGGKNKEKIKKALEFAFSKEKELKEKEKKEFLQKIKSENTKIILVSHPYNLYDEYVNLRMKEKLEKLGSEVIFIDEVPLKMQNAKCKMQNVDWPEFHWEFGKEIMHKIEEILKYQISGVIQISSFACGCDAVLKEFVEKKIKQDKIPFLYLIIDEHTGEAGLQTRLEAFLDTLS